MADTLATLVPLLGQALLHFLWQGALIGLGAALLLSVLRDARPQTRYAVSCLALLACVLAPVATIVAGLASGTVAAGAAANAADPLVVGAIVPAPGNALLAWAAPASGIEAYLPAIVATWAVGMGLMSLRMAFGLAWVRRLRRAPQLPAQPAWQARLDALAAHFQLSRFVELRLVDALDSPVAAGWWKPVVLLPAGLVARLPTDLIEALLAHELAHIRRHDYLVNLLQNAVESLLFYHPVTWWLSHRIRVEREQVADQLASEVACAPRRLALALSELSDLQRSAPALHLLQAAHGGQLMSRIQRLVGSTRRTHPGARIVFPLLGLAAFSLASYTWAGIGDPAAATNTAVSVSAAVATAADEPAGTVRSVKRERKVSVEHMREFYALVEKRGERITSHGSIDLDSIDVLQSQPDGDFLWFRRDGRDYKVTDPAILARAREAWRETEAIDARMEPLSDQMEVHGDRMDALGEKMEALAEDHRPSDRMRAAEREMRALQRKQRELEHEHDAVEERIDDIRDGEGEDLARLRPLQSQLEALSHRQEELGRLMELQGRIIEEESRQMERYEAPMEELSRQMEEAGKPMEALGRQMEVLGEQMEVASRKAELRMREIIDEAMRKQLARPMAAR